MKKAVSIILALVLCLSLIPAGYADDISFSDDPKAIQAASNSVVMLSCYDKGGNLFATGSAFAAFDDGVFVTNYHVIEDVYSIRAQMETGLEFKINTIVAYDAEKDIAILRTDAKTGLEPLPLGDSSKLDRAEKVIAIGSPLGLINTITIGLYSGIIKDDGVFLQFSAPISQGSSGGALFNNNGEVVGITSASYTKGQNLNLAIPIDDVKALYEKANTIKPINLSEFYDSFDHTPPIPTYTVGYVLENYKKLDGQILYMEGYVSSLFSIGNNPTSALDLVDNPESVLGIQQGGFFSNDYAEWTRKEETRIDAFQALQIWLPDDCDVRFSTGDKVSALCLLEYKKDARPNKGAWNLLFTAYEIDIVE